MSTPENSRKHNQTLHTCQVKRAYIHMPMHSTCGIRKLLRTLKRAFLRNMLISPTLMTNTDNTNTNETKKPIGRQHDIAVSEECTFPRAVIRHHDVPCHSAFCRLSSCDSIQQRKGSSTKHQITTNVHAGE